MILREDPLATSLVGNGAIAGAQGSPPVNAQQQFLYRVMNRIAGVDANRRVLSPVHSYSDDYEGGYRNYAQKHAPHHHLEHARQMLSRINARGIHRV